MKDNLGAALLQAVKSMVISFLKIVGLIAIWVLRTLGMILTKTSDGLEKILIK
ncbi:MAG: hypothetical protein RJA07_2384 [Bacteroidota bacterium]|jgi:hypothetical protein